MTHPNRVRRAYRAMGLALAFILVAGLPVWARTMVPEHLRMTPDGSQSLDLHLPISVTVRADREHLLMLNGGPIGMADRRIRLGSPLHLAALGLGQTELEFRAFGLIPLRRMAVEVVPPRQLVPGGQSIGVLLRSAGVMVVGQSPVHDDQGRSLQPGRDGGIEVGDVIEAINGVQATSEQQVADAVQHAGRLGLPLRLRVRRHDQRMERVIWPAYDRQARQHRIGLYVRDGAAGVGTLTFIDPDTGRFGALGHVIAEGETGTPIPVRDGHIVEAAISAIDPGRPGNPGEMIGVFVHEDQWLGTIEKNTPFGVFGTVAGTRYLDHSAPALPVALSNQVREGPAEITTVVQGQKAERFAIEIVRKSAFPGPDGRHMVIRVTDPQLLARTRGIVQGMSGSPIIQDGRLVGAVTHVFVNDPAQGYGVFVESMLQEAGLLHATPAASSGSNLPGLVAVALLLPLTTACHPGRMRFRQKKNPSAGIFRSSTEVDREGCNLVPFAITTPAEESRNARRADSHRHRRRQSGILRGTAGILRHAGRLAGGGRGP